MLPVAGAGPVSATAPLARKDGAGAEVVAIDPSEDRAITEQNVSAIASIDTPKSAALGDTAPSLEETHLFGVSRVPADEPTLTDARWLGVLRAVSAAQDGPPGMWISGPVDPDETIGWAANARTGTTIRVKFIWRDAAETEPVQVSSEAAQALGLKGNHADELGIYLPRTETTQRP